MTLIESQTFTSQIPVVFEDIPQTYSGLLFELVGVTLDGGASQAIYVELSTDPDAIVWSTSRALNVSAASGQFYGDLTIRRYTGNSAVLRHTVVNAPSTPTIVGAAATAPRDAVARLGGPLRHARFGGNGNTPISGTIALYGMS